MGRGNARGRISVRSRVRACAQSRGRKHAASFPPSYPAGPDSFERETYCGTVGRWRRRLSGRKFSCAVVGMEWKISRQRSQFWKGDEGRIGEMGYRLTGSPDLYQHNGRRPYASINFVTAHDGFTLNDLVSYNDKHNEANGDGNKDGDNNNLSWNCGAEGPTEDPQINALRERQRRNFLTTLFLSQGVPMLSGGDEWGRSQTGNNNAYCQDNEISWFNWTHDQRQNQFLEFTRKLIAFRNAHPVFRRPKFLQGRRIRGSEIRDVMWFNPGGNEMSDEEWSSPFRSLYWDAAEWRFQRCSQFRRRADP